MATEEPRTSSVVRVHVELVIDPALAELDVRVAQAEPVASAGLEDRVVPAVRAALVVPENPVAPVGLAVRVAPVGLADPVGERVLVIVPVVAEPALLTDRAVARALVIALEEVREPERGQVVAGPVLDQVEAQRRTRSATAARHRGQVPAPRVEDSAVAAQTTREPVAAEVVVAWAAAV